MFELVLTNNKTCFSVTLFHLYIHCSFPFIYYSCHGTSGGFRGGGHSRLVPPPPFETFFYKCPPFLYMCPPPFETLKKKKKQKVSDSARLYPAPFLKFLDPPLHGTIHASQAHKYASEQ